MNTVDRFSLAVALLVLAGCTGMTPGTVTPTQSDHEQIDQVEMGDVQRASHRVFNEADGTVDLYGNEVIDAVAKYTLDPAGTPYEVHSPQTELPRLGSPKS